MASDEGSARRIARYEATVATGLEDIAQEEITEKLDAKTNTQKGRVIIETDKPVSDILNLKSINNLFVIIHDEFVSDDEMPKNAGELELLMLRVCERCNWRSGLAKWTECNDHGKFNLDQLMDKSEDLRSVQPSFRVSSNRYGPRHKFTSPEICAQMGNAVDVKFGWPIKLKGFDLEIYTNFNENHLYVTLTLTPISLACRNIISTGYTTLKAVTCYALLRVAKVQTGDIVIDPMAGSGAIPVENVAAWNNLEWFSYTLGSDLTQNILEKFKTNMGLFRSAEKLPPSDILMFDATKGALRDNSVDVIVSDLPFGRRHGSKTTNRVLYPRLMLDLGRLAQLGTGRAALLTQDFKSMNIALERTRDYWVQKLCKYTKVGNLDCWIYLFHRTNRPFRREESELNLAPKSNT